MLKTSIVILTTKHLTLYYVKLKGLVQFLIEKKKKKSVVGDGFSITEGSSSLMVSTVNVYIPPYGDVIS